MDSPAAGGAYAHLRFMHQRSEDVGTPHRQIHDLPRDEGEALGVRGRVGGAGVFAATRDTSRAGAEAALARALAIAGAQPPGDATPLAPEPPARGRHKG